MCGTCDARSRHWTSTRLILLTFLVALLILSVAGLAGRGHSSDNRALAPCAVASTAALRFQSDVTRNLRSHPRLHRDTTRFVSELRSLDASGCSATQRFLRAGGATLAALCEDCAVAFWRLREDSS